MTIYQRRHLGGTGKDTGKRHPTIGNNVVVAARAKILGPFTVGDNTKVGAGAAAAQTGARQLRSWACPPARSCARTTSRFGMWTWIRSSCPIRGEGNPAAAAPGLRAGAAGSRTDDPAHKGGNDMQITTP